MRNSKNSKNYVYIALCRDGTLYTGWTSDVERRTAAHNGGFGAKYTRGRAPVVVIYQEECACRGEALRREREIKKLTRRRKLELAGGLNNNPGRRIQGVKRAIKKLEK